MELGAPLAWAAGRGGARIAGLCAVVEKLCAWPAKRWIDRRCCDEAGPCGRRHLYLDGNQIIGATLAMNAHQPRASRKHQPDLFAHRFQCFLDLSRALRALRFARGKPNQDTNREQDASPSCELPCHDEDSWSRFASAATAGIELLRRDLFTLLPR
jgi:hypothetical protein